MMRAVAVCYLAMLHLTPRWVTAAAAVAALRCDCLPDLVPTSPAVLSAAAARVDGGNTGDVLCCQCCQQVISSFTGRLANDWASVAFVTWPVCLQTSSLAAAIQTTRPSLLRYSVSVSMNPAGCWYCTERSFCSSVDDDWQGSISTRDQHLSSCWCRCSQATASGVNMTQCFDVAVKWLDKRQMYTVSGKRSQ